MTERRDADLFEVLIGQIRQQIKGDVVLGKAVSVLPETKHLKPVCNLLHRDPVLFTGDRQTESHVIIAVSL